MMRRYVLAGTAALSVALALAACSGGDAKPPPPLPLGSGGASSQAGSGGLGLTGGSATTGGSGNQAGAGAASGNGSGSGGEGGGAGFSGNNTGGEEGGAAGAPPVDPSTCGALDFDAGQPIAELNTAGDDRLLDVTPDELSVLWAVTTQGITSVHIADRSSPAEPFQDSLPVGIPEGYDTSRGVALSPDGLRLVLVNTLGTKFAELRRPARAMAFGANAYLEAFDIVNRLTAVANLTFANPVLHAGGEHFFFVQHRATSAIAQSSNNAGVWTNGNPITGPTLRGTAEGAKLLTGVSSDLRTFFYFNAANATPEARTRDSVASSPLHLTALPGFFDARPNASCSRLYFTHAGDTSKELYVAEAR
jgi:hypothetical protein